MLENETGGHRAIPLKSAGSFHVSVKNLRIDIDVWA
jgi:hypothetical protein